MASVHADNAEGSCGVNVCMILHTTLWHVPTLSAISFWLPAERQSRNRLRNQLPEFDLARVTGLNVAATVQRFST